MNLHQRMQHFVLVVSFIMLALSGFALKYPESWLGWLFGSDEAVRRWVHRASGVIMLGGGLVAHHLCHLHPRWPAVGEGFPADMQDVRDVFGNLLYFVGKKPRATRASAGSAMPRNSNTGRWSGAP